MIDRIAVSHTHHQHPKLVILYRWNDSVRTDAVAPIFAQFPGLRVGRGLEAIRAAVWTAAAPATPRSDGVKAACPMPWVPTLSRRVTVPPASLRWALPTA